MESLKTIRNLASNENKNKTNELIKFFNYTFNKELELKENNKDQYNKICLFTLALFKFVFLFSLIQKLYAF